MKLGCKRGQSFWIISFIGCMLLTALAQVLPLSTGLAYAEQATIEIQSEVGFGASNVKQGSVAPATITLKNTGASVSGDLVIQIGNPDGKDFSYAQHVELPQGSTKVIKMSLPSYAYSKDNNSLSFYENSVQSGKKLSLLGNTYLEAFFMSKDIVQVGVLAPDVDTLNFLALLSQFGKKVNVLHLKQPDISESAMGLDMLDVLVLNDFASDTLTHKQVEAIQVWTKRGGTLILGGGAGYAKTAAPFAKDAPVVYQGTLSVQELPEMAKTGEKELKLSQPFTISQGQLTQGAESLIVEDDLPIYARKAYGMGFIVYVAYDLSLNPIASWNGNPRLWERMLASPLDTASAITGNQMRYGTDPYWEMARALEYFPTLQSPKLAGLAWVLLLYAVTVAPLLYFILRRLDRREWAWVLIPLLSLVTSIGIFQFSATNRGNMMAQALHTIELDGSGSGVKHSALSVFLPKGGSLELPFTPGEVVRPFMRSENYSMQQLNKATELVIRPLEEGAKVRLQNIPYSSLSKMVVDEEKPVSIGKLDYKITMMMGNAAKGEVTNNTKKDLVDAAVLVNQSYINLGSLKAGDSVSFDTSNGIGVNDYQGVANSAFPDTSQRGIDLKFHQRTILSSYLFAKARLTGGFEPMIMGWVKEQTPMMLANGKKLPTEQLTLFVQNMKINYVSSDGKIAIPSALLFPELVDNHLKMSAFNFRNDTHMEIGSGDVTFEYRLPVIPKAVYQTMSMQSESNKDVTFEIWNGQSQSWEALDVKPLMKWEGDALQSYLVEGKKIRLKAATAQNNTLLRIPAVSLEGVVKP
ncbi:hypothetical protein GK047_04255 [Paenibacillus sp. SYP-B3998]|uniref:DUF7408 domain-containing protein n=1 Tax=Paenibacillus sp. SYP-B3998 TaxID=2678564 RepID=A0A6G3ZSW4_9BACL|nr:hypothetical protein [Paenibacillus sp. SYP-B3998]NEW05232.1 hypothetical protein [Paenibacillus sp. SYP-B3998]